MSTSLLFLRRAGLTSLLATTVALTQAQDRPRVYPAAEPAAADSLRPADPKQFANTSVLGQGPSKGLIVRYERLPEFNVTSTSDPVKPNGAQNEGGVGNYSGRVHKNALLTAKAYIPFLNHPHLKLILGLNYMRQEFQFDDAPTTYELYQNIENKALTTIGSQLAVIRPIDEVHWLIFRAKGELSGDYLSDELNVTDYLKVSSELLYGWKRSPTFAWGLGVQLGYTFGRQSIYPVLIYNRSFNSHWGVEALFPARVTGRYNLSDKTLLFGGYEVESNNYNIKLRNPLFANQSPPLTTLELRQIDIKFRLRLEREIFSVLWMGVEGGYRYNYSFSAYDRRDGERSNVISTDFANSPYFSLDLFLVPPRKLLERAGVRR